MDPVVSSHTRACGNFTDCTKIKIKKDNKKTKTKTNKQKTNRGWKEEIVKHGIRTAKRRKVKLALFSILCRFMAIAITQRKSYRANKDADSFGHRLHYSVSSF